MRRSIRSMINGGRHNERACMRLSIVIDCYSRVGEYLCFVADKKWNA
jgi:hypothetical protein